MGLCPVSVPGHMLPVHGLAGPRQDKVGGMAHGHVSKALRQFQGDDMTYDEIDKWIQDYKRIEGLIWYFIKGSKPSAECPNLTLYGDKIEAEYTVRVRGHYETHFSTYDSADLAAMFDQLAWLDERTRT